MPISREMGFLVGMPQCTFLNDSIFQFFPRFLLTLRFRLASSCFSFIVAGGCIEQSVRWLLFGSNFIHFYSFLIMDRNLVSVVSQVHTTFGDNSNVSVQLCIHYTLYMLCVQTNSALFHRYSISMHFLFHFPIHHLPPHPRSLFLFVLFASIHFVSFFFVTLFCRDIRIRMLIFIFIFRCANSMKIHV